jgi:hypothetical protein
MKQWLRRIRAAIGIGLAWAIAWFGAGIVLLLKVGVGAADVPFPLLFGLLGFLAGATFSGVLATVEGRHRFDRLSLPRFAGWGAVGGLLLSLMLAALESTGGQAGGPPLVRVMEHWPAGGRVLPRLLASVHGEVHERAAVVHGLYAAFRPSMR